MGLDITVYKLHKATEEDMYSRLNYFLLENNEGHIFYDYHHKFPKWALKFIVNKAMEFYDWDKYSIESGIDINSIKIMSIDLNKGLVEGKDAQNKIINISLDDIPITTAEIPVIGRSEIGYQRKGLNGKFYQDYDCGIIGYLVWTKKELLEYKRNYCTTLEDKEEFQRNIIDNFIPKQSCVTFDW